MELPAGEAAASAEKLQFHYQKALSYHTIHADGAVGSITPRGHVALTFFNERGVIPRTTSRPILSETDGTVTLGNEEYEDSLDGVMRQIEVTVFLDLNSVKDVTELLRRIQAKLPASNGAPVVEESDSGD